MENQFGIISERSTMEATYLLRRLMEKYRESKRELHIVFTDLKKLKYGAQGDNMVGFRKERNFY